LPLAGLEHDHAFDFVHFASTFVVFLMCNQDQVINIHMLVIRHRGFSMLSLVHLLFAVKLVLVTKNTELELQTRVGTSRKESN
jgi:hypothetical protein